MCCRATLAMEVSSTSMNAASATVAAISQGLVRGFHMPCTAADGPVGRGGAGAPEIATPATGALPAGALGCNSANQLLLIQTWYRVEAMIFMAGTRNPGTERKTVFLSLDS